MNRRWLLASAGGLTLAAVAAAWGLSPTATTQPAAPANAVAASPADPTPTSATLTATAEVDASAPDEYVAKEETALPAASDNPTPEHQTSDSTAPDAEPAGPPADPLAATRPLPYNPDDKDSVISRYARDRARLDEVLAAGVPVLWVTDAIW